MIINVILIITMLICAFGWLIQWTCTAALVMWVCENDVVPPKEAIRENLKFVWKKLLRVK